MHCWIVVLISLVLVCQSRGQFIDAFDGTSLSEDPRGVNGWGFFTGDGSAVMDFSLSGKGWASVTVDATKDLRGIWWALIKHRVSGNMDLSLLRQRSSALRIEARIRTSHAPRRVNLHLNTQRTTNFHTHLMEFDIPDTTRWHTISMTTQGFDAVPGDSVYGQLALMDWGPGKYRVDLDYIRADIINVDSAGPDMGAQVPYHPTVPDTSAFGLHLPVAADCTIDREFPDRPFGSWTGTDIGGSTTILTVSGTQFVILRWDLRRFRGRKVEGEGLLELTTYALQRLSDSIKDFGMVRVSEIIGGEPHWNRKTVSYATLCGGKALDDVINSQMIIDVDVAQLRGGKTFATISRPVLQRMIDGTTLGLAIRPLGAVHASFYAAENQGGTQGAVLHFGVTSESPSPAPRTR